VLQCHVALTTTTQDHTHNPRTLPLASSKYAQCVAYAVCCSVLQCISMCCSVSCRTHHYATRPHSQPPHATISFIKIHAVCCIRSVSQCVAECHVALTTTLQDHTHNPSHATISLIKIRAVLLLCSVLQCVAVCCSVLQCVAVCHVALTTTLQDHTHTPRMPPLAQSYMLTISRSRL